MNVMKNEFTSKRRRTRIRHSQYPKSSVIGYHTVSKVSLPITNVLEFDRNAIGAATYLAKSTFPSSSSLYSSVCLRQQISFSEENSEEYKKNKTREILLDEDGNESTEDENITPFLMTDSANNDTDIEFEKLMESYHNTHEIPNIDKNFIFCTIRERMNENITSENDRKSVEKCKGSSRRTSSKNISESEEDATDFLAEDLNFIFNTTRTPTTNTRTHRFDNSLSSNYATNQSIISSKNQSRTSSSKSPKTLGKNSFDIADECYILAVTEGRGLARGEVGIAAMDPRRPYLILCQISDNQRYVHSLAKMNVFSSREIIMPSTFIAGLSASKLYAEIRENFPNVTVTAVQRRHFNETLGLDLISQYGSPESESVMVLVKDKFYALSAASALIKYIEYTHNILFVSRSLKVQYEGTEDTMVIDLDTANRLELVTSRIKTKSTLNNTLLGVLKHCRTKGGLRLLRANILQPPCIMDKIKIRLDCVTELINKPLLSFALEAAVVSFANVENLLSLCLHEPEQDGLRAADFQLKYVLLLKSILELLPNLTKPLGEATSAYFCVVREDLEDMRYKIILNRILETVSENAKNVKGSVSAHLHACFAIKTGINGLLDVAKKTYCETVQEIWEHVNGLKEKHNMPLKMCFTSQRGFHIQCPASFSEKNISPSDLPKEFILVDKTKSTYICYTSELVALDQRSKQTFNEVKMMTNVILFELLNDVQQHVGCLFNLCEHIAELDVILSFVHVSSGQDFVRPQFGNVLNLTESRHPVLDVIYGGKIASNDIFAETERNCVILTGPNQSGKSVYIGQVALLQIMAQIGCYVPARTATFRLTDRLFARLGFEDSIEANASTLIAEMRDMAYLRQSITSTSLVVIDEPCRGTSVDEGTSLAFTIIEEFLDYTAFIFLTTHFMFLTKLEDLYFNVVNYHFQSEMIEPNDEDISLRFSHKKFPGVTKAEQYGLKIAERSTFPSDVLCKANEIAQSILMERKPLPEVSGLSVRYKLSQELMKELSSGPEKTWNEIEPAIGKLKTSLLSLGTLDDNYNSVNMEFGQEEVTNEAGKLQNQEVLISRQLVQGNEISQSNPCLIGCSGDISSEQSHSCNRKVPSDHNIPCETNKWAGHCKDYKYLATTEWQRQGKIKLIHHLSRNIKRKYKNLIMRNVSYKAFRAMFLKGKRSKQDSEQNSFFSKELFLSISEQNINIKPDRKFICNFD